MTFRPVTTLCLMLVLCGCARGVSEAGSLTEPVGEVDGGGLDAGGMSGSDAMTGPVLDAGGKDAGQTMMDGGLNGNDAGKDSGTAATCQTANTCGSARSLGSIAGDDGSPKVTATGMRGEWLSVAVTDTGGIVGTYNATNDLRARITLTSNDGANYDLFLVRPPDSARGNNSAISDCGAPPVSSELASGIDVVSTAWPDDPNAAFGEDAGDAFTLSIEVRHVSGPCGSWNLTVEGNK